MSSNLNNDSKITFLVLGNEYKLAWKYAKYCVTIKNIIDDSEGQMGVADDMPIPLSFDQIPDFTMAMFDTFIKYIDHLESDDFPEPEPPKEGVTGIIRRQTMTPVEEELFGSLPMLELHKLTLFGDYLACKEFNIGVTLQISKLIEPLTVEEIRAKWPELLTYGPSGSAASTSTAQSVSA